MGLLKDSWLRRRRRERRGGAMVEMALILPILIALTFGVIEYGWMFYRVSQINLASRHGVRAAVRPAADQTEVEAAVAAIMNEAGWDDGEYTVQVGDLTVPVGDPVSVRVEVDYQYIALTGLPFLPVPESLTGAAAMAKEGPQN